MFKVIDYKDLEGNYVLIDVRSPKEFKEATIPGAVNIPLLDDEDRKNVGTVYINESVEKAKKLGIEAVSRRLPEIYDEISKLDKSFDKLIFFCARGGMRSTSLCSLCNSLGINSFRIKNGYKGYRDFINKELPKVNENVKYIVLHGKTGVGKTEMLYSLKNKGLDVLDLEGAANHRGSLLGNVGLGDCRSQKHFESAVYETLKNRKTNYVFVEGESKRIGNIVIPKYIYDNMISGMHILVDADIDFRSKVILSEYTKSENCKEEILQSLDKMSRYISHENIKKYRNYVEDEKYNEVACELMIKYYDPMYTNGINKYSYDLEVNVTEIEEAAVIIEKWAIENLNLIS